MTKNHDDLPGPAFLPPAFICFTIPVLAVPAPRGTTVVVAIVAVSLLVVLANNGVARAAFRANFGSTREPSGILPGLGLLSLFVLWGTISLVWSTDPALSHDRIVKISAGLLSGALTVLAARTLPPVVRRCCGLAAVLGLVVAGVLLWFEHLSGAQMAFLLGDAEWMANPLNRRLIYNRSLAILVPVTFVVAAAWSGLQMWGRVGLVAGTLLVATVTLVLDSGAAIAALLAGVIVFAMSLAAPASIRVALPIVLLAVFLGSPIAARFGGDVAERMVPGAGENPAISHRLLVWDFVAERATERPVTGWGLGTAKVIPGGNDNFGGAFAIHSLRKLPTHPHNGALQIWLELGAVGATIAALFLVWLTRAAGRACDTVVLASRYSALVASLVIASSAYGIWQSWLLAAFALTTGLAVLLSNGEDRLQLTRPENKAP